MQNMENECIFLALATDYDGTLESRKRISEVVTQRYTAPSKGQ